VIGTDLIQPPDAKFPKLRKPATIKVGRPINVERYRTKSSDRLVLRQVTDELMYEIRELTGQEYRDTYATKKSENIPADKAVIAHVHEDQAARQLPALTGAVGE
jgi:1-acyl-sn-glycerol-3-phosphate acyltransferase